MGQEYRVYCVFSSLLVDLDTFYSFLLSDSFVVIVLVSDVRLLRPCSHN